MILCVRNDFLFIYLFIYLLHRKGGTHYNTYKYMHT